MSLLDQFPDRCTIRRRTRSKGTLGGGKDGSTDEQTGVQCWEQAANASEVERYNKRGQVVTRKVYFLSDPGVTEKHQIVVTSRTANNGTLTAVPISSQVPLDVVAKPEPDASAGKGILFKVMADFDQGRLD